VGESWELIVQAPKELAAFLAYKGSITVNGVSLTVNRVEDVAGGTQFSINLIPHTISVTTLNITLSRAKSKPRGRHDCPVRPADAVARPVMLE
jgi:riboflavin synthase alpha subunit